MIAKVRLRRLDCWCGEAGIWIGDNGGIGNFRRVSFGGARG